MKTESVKEIRERIAERMIHKSDPNIASAVIRLYAWAFWRLRSECYPMHAALRCPLERSFMKFFQPYNGMMTEELYWEIVPYNIQNLPTSPFEILEPYVATLGKEFLDEIILIPNGMAVNFGILNNSKDEPAPLLSNKFTYISGLITKALKELKDSGKFDEWEVSGELPSLTESNMNYWTRLIMRPEDLVAAQAKEPAVEEELIPVMEEPAVPSIDEGVTESYTPDSFKSKRKSMLAKAKAKLAD